MSKAKKKTSKQSATGAKKTAQTSKEATTTKEANTGQRGGNGAKRASGLGEAGEPMSCKAIVEKMLAEKLWQTKGKTPQSTIYAAIVREIAAKGEKARFKKTDRGKFVLAG